MAVKKNLWGGAEHGGRKIFRPEAEHGGTAPPRPVAESAVAIYIPGYKKIKLRLAYSLISVALLRLTRNSRLWIFIYKGEN